MTGVNAAEGLVMMSGVHGGKEVSGGFVVVFALPVAPVHEEAVVQAPEHPDPPHRPQLAHTVMVVLMGHIQALVCKATKVSTMFLTSSLSLSAAVALAPSESVAVVGAATPNPVLQHQPLFGLRFGVAGQPQLPSVGQGQMDIEHQANFTNW